MLTDNDVLMLMQAAELNAGSKMATIHTKQLLAALKELHEHRQNAKNTVTFANTNMTILTTMGSVAGPKVVSNNRTTNTHIAFIFDGVKVGDKFFERNINRTYTVTELTEKGFKYDVYPYYHALPARMGPSLVKSGELFIDPLLKDYWNTNFEKVTT